MKLAEAKRKLTVGTKVTLTWHKYAASWRQSSSEPEARAERTALESGEGITRVVAVMHTNAVAFRAEGSKNLSWLYWPKASEFRSDNENEFTILEENSYEPLMKYRIETNGATS